MPPEATLLPPPPSDFEDDLDRRGSTRTLDEVGAVTVLGAMIEQRRKSQPFLEAQAAEARELETPPEEARVVTKSGVQTRGAGGPVRRHSEGFLKVR